MKVWLKARLGDEYQAVKVDAIVVVMCILIGVIGASIAHAIKNKPEPAPSNVCRNEFGHRIEC